jgi:outer membrane protein
MTRTLVRAAFLVVMSVFAAANQSWAQAPKLGVINSQALLAQAPGTPAAMAAFEQSMQGYQQEITRLQTELQALQDSLDRQGASLTAAVRQQRTDEIQEKYVAFQLRQQELQQTAEQREGELVGPIIQQIETIVEQMRAEGGYAIIFDVASGPSIFAVDPALDLTQQVLDRLRSAPVPVPAPVSAPAAAPPATPPSP